MAIADLLSGGTSDDVVIRGGVYVEGRFESDGYIEALKDLTENIEKSRSS